MRLCRDGTRHRRDWHASSFSAFLVKRNKQKHPLGVSPHQSQNIPNIANRHCWVWGLKKQYILFRNNTAATAALSDGGWRYKGRGKEKVIVCAGWKKKQMVGGGTWWKGLWGGWRAQMGWNCCVSKCLKVGKVGIWITLRCCSHTAGGNNRDNEMWK